MKKQILMAIFVAVFFASNAFALSEAYKENIYQVGKLKPVDSVLKVKVGQKAPDFTLKAVSGKKVSLKRFQRQKECRAFLCSRRLDTGVLRPVAWL